MEARFPLGEDTLWFVFHDDRQLGPFVTSELAKRLNHGELPDSVYVWAQGFDDWKPIAAVPGFDSYRLDVQSIEDVEAVEKLNQGFEMAGAEFVATETPDTNRQEAAEIGIWNEKNSQVNNTKITNSPQPETDEAGETPFKKILVSWIAQHRFLTASAALSLLFAGAFVFQMFSGTRGLSRQELAPDDFRNLKASVLESLIFSGPTAAIAVATTSIETPMFIVGTNLADGAKITVKIDGVPESMVGRFYYSMKTTVTVKNGVAKTGRLRENAKDAAAFLPGLYKVTLFNEADQTALHQRTFFLGSAGSGDFNQALKTYHEKLRARADEEILEARQFVDTITKVLQESNSWFRSVQSSDSTANRKKAWALQDSKFQALDIQLASIEAQWNAEPAKASIYHFELFTKISQILKLLREVHQTQGEALLESAA
ncbi:MAG: DUF4339 domain-containing protein, partial [Bdellovibrionales bacterium]|nr:DUF4339 domain-containing protein [Bdellovibrionales bacterium]